jgi:uncharacterized RDD family membrane protein YckC
MIRAKSSCKEHTVSTPNNYAPPQSVVADIPATDTPFEKASRASRLGAKILDGLIFGIPLIPSEVVAFNAVLHSSSPKFSYFGFWTAMVSAGILFYVGVLVDLVLLAVMTMLVYRDSQTFGKKLLGIKIARPDGSRASLGRIFWLRYLLNQVISWLAILLLPLAGALYSLVDDLMIFGEQRRCVHDYIADTIVIRA